MSPATEPTHGPPRAVGVAATLLGIGALLWACRGAPLGTAVADDYFFLNAREFFPLRAFDSMSVPFYWRPLSRQVYFTLVGPLSLSAPWMIAVLHASMLVAIGVLMYRVARRAWPRPVSAAIALVPLLSEPARVLLAWPSGAQHLLPALFATLAVHEAVAGRLWSAGGAALGASLSHEAGILVVPALPIIAWCRTPRSREVWRWAAVAVGVAALWGAGYAIALRDGVQLPGGHGHGPSASVLPGLFTRASMALLNLEDLPTNAARGFLLAHALLILAALFVVARRRARPRLVSHLPTLLLGAGWFVLGTALLAFVLPDWNAWRAWYAALGAGVALTVLLAVAWPPLAAGFVALRFVALMIAPAAPPLVTRRPPPTASKMSFTRLVRLQRVVGSTRTALLIHARHLQRGAEVRYWAIPREVLLGFQDSLAVHVWYRDTTLTWGAFGGAAGLTRRVDALVEFIENEPSPAAVVPDDATAAFQRAGLAAQAERFEEADSLLAIAERSSLRRGTFLGAVELNRATFSYRRGDYARADSLLRASIALAPDAANAWVLAAHLALLQEDRAAALQAIRRCLALEPGNPEGRRLAGLLGSP